MDLKTRFVGAQRLKDGGLELLKRVTSTPYACKRGGDPRAVHRPASLPACVRYSNLGGLNDSILMTKLFESVPDCWHQAVQ